LKAPLKYKIKL